MDAKLCEMCQGFCLVLPITAAIKGQQGIFSIPCCSLERKEYWFSIQTMLIVWVMPGSALNELRLLGESVLLARRWVTEVVRAYVQPSFCIRVKSVASACDTFIWVSVKEKSACFPFSAHEKHGMYVPFLDYLKQAPVWYFFQISWLILFLSKSLLLGYHCFCCPGKEQS